VCVCVSAVAFPESCHAIHLVTWGVRIHMGWLRLVGSLKSQVSFAEYTLFYSVLL